MSVPRFSVQRPVLIWVIFAGMILIGLVSLYTLPTELYQGSSRGIISIIIRARGGLPPVEVERMITRPVEEAVATTSYVKNMYSNSREAESRVTLEFEPGTDMRFAGLEVREKFSRVKGILPEEIEKPVIANFQDSDAAILIFAVTSTVLNPEEIRQLVDQDLKPRLDRVDGVASVEVYGGRERKILVELDRDKMFAYNISIERVMDVIGASNIALLAGSFERGSYDFALRTMGAFTNVEEIGNLGVKATRHGSIIPLKEIATVKDSFLEPEDYSRLNLDQNVSVYVKKASLANTIAVVEKLKRAIDRFTEEQKGNVRTPIVADKAKLIKRAIGDVWKSLSIGVFLVAVIVYWALRRWILSLIVLSTIPIALVTTFIFMAIFGLSLNVMTLSGLALSIGIMVDSAIVVIENSVKKSEEGLEHHTAVIEGADEVWLPLFASLLTSLCVFLPVIFIDKEIQIIYQGFAFTVSAALTMSLVVAIMLVPMLLSKSKLSFQSENQAKDEAQPKMILDRAKLNYGNFMRSSLRFRHLFLLIVVGIFLFSIWRLMIRHIDLPSQLEENEFAIVVFPLAGAKLDANDEVAKRLENLLNGYKELEMVSTTVQKDDLKLFVRLKPRAKRKISKEMIMNEVKEKGNELIKQIHDDYSLIVDEGAASEEAKKMVINIFGLENDTLEKLAHEVAQKINSIKGLTNLVMTDLRKRPEYSVVVDKGRAAFYGLTVNDIADSIHAQVRGMRPTKFHEIQKGQEIETITRLQPIYRQKIDDLQNIYFVSPKDGTQVPLKQIAGIYPSRGPQTIDRKDKYRYVFVKGDVHRPLETIAEGIKAALKDLKMPKDYFWRFGGRYEELMKGKSQLAIGVILSIVLVYMVIACLYQSYLEPLIIMIAVPLGAVGVWAALSFTRKPLSEQVFIGMFILVGYVVNASIILVDRINHLKPKFSNTVDCLIQAAQDRLRPILVTTGSTVIGFIPMAIDRGESSELWSPLAITMIGGILSSTFLTLFVVPLVYLLLEDVKKKIQRFNLIRFTFFLPRSGDANTKFS
ncbi:MAG: efflux RND transporter permease subunit [Candidatus Omnitrophica bacterium]|nr:efflux RND transporter permease subunit [Candidatus Omnitrophota bacterium]